jgi:hypothetical protein
MNNRKIGVWFCENGKNFKAGTLWGNFRFRSQKQKKLLKMSKPLSQRNGGIPQSISV